MFLRLVLASIRRNGSRALALAAAFFIAALALSSAAAFTIDAGFRMRARLKEYGPNLVLLPSEGRSVSSPEALPPGAAPLLLGPVEVSGKAALLCGAGRNFLSLSPWIETDGEFPPARGECFLGVRAAERLGAGVGDEIEIQGATAGKFKVRGLLRGEDEEEGRIYVSLPVAGEILGIRGGVSLALVRAEAPGGFSPPPGFRAEPITELSLADRALMERIRGILILGVIGVLTGCLVCVAGLVSASLLERRKELATMLSIGGTPREILKLLITEHLLVGAGGVFAGLWAGTAVAFEMSRRILEVEPVLRWPAVVGTALLLSAVGTGCVVVVARRHLRGTQAHVLGGE